MSALGLWGVPAPDPGTAARESDTPLDRPSSAWAPQFSLRGTLGVDVGTASRAAFEQHAGTFSELIALRETLSAQASYDAGSAFILIAALDAFAATTSQPAPFAVLCGVLETYSVTPQGQAAIVEALGVLEAWAGIDSTAEGGLGSWEDVFAVVESYTGRQGGQGVFADRFAAREAWTGAAGIIVPPPVGVLSDTVLRARIGSRWIRDIYKRIGKRPQ